MMRLFLRSQIHGATVTEADLHRHGSIALDRHLMHAADLIPFEKVSVHNLGSGEQFEGYITEGVAGSGGVSLNGAAAQKGRRGDKIIIACYGALHAGQILDHKPRFVFVDAENRVTTLTEMTTAASLEIS